MSEVADKDVAMLQHDDLGQLKELNLTMDQASSNTCRLGGKNAQSSSKIPSAEAGTASLVLPVTANSAAVHLSFCLHPLNATSIIQ